MRMQTYQTYNNPATWSKIHTANATDTHSGCRLWNRAREWAPSTKHIRTNKHTHRYIDRASEWVSKRVSVEMARCVCLFACARERVSVRIEKRMENQFSDAWKGGCVWPHLYFDAIGRALVAKASKGPRWKLYTHTVHTYSSSTLILARASNTDFNDFYDAQLVSFVCTLSVYIYVCCCFCYSFFLLSNCCFPSLFVCQCQFLSYFFSAILSFTCLHSSCSFFLHCLYNMINVYVYIVVRSKRKYIRRMHYVSLTGRNRDQNGLRCVTFRERKLERQREKENRKEFSRQPNFMLTLCMPFFMFESDLRSKHACILNSQALSLSLVCLLA